MCICEACGGKTVVFIKVGISTKIEGELGAINVCPTCVSRWERRDVETYECKKPAKWFSRDKGRANFRFADDVQPCVGVVPGEPDPDERIEFYRNAKTTMNDTNFDDDDKKFEIRRYE